MLDGDRVRVVRARPQVHVQVPATQTETQLSQDGDDDGAGANVEAALTDADLEAMSDEQYRQRVPEAFGPYPPCREQLYLSICEGWFGLYM